MARKVLGGSGLAAIARLRRRIGVPLLAFLAIGFIGAVPFTYNINGLIHYDQSGAGTGPFVPMIEGVPLTPLASTAGEASHVLKASAGNLFSVYAVNLTNAAGFLVVVNATAAPSNGASITPLDFVNLPAGGNAAINLGVLPNYYSTGIVALVTSAATPFTYTTGTITAAISGRAQ